MENNSNNKYFVIFGGGGIRGIAYAGAQKALEENNIEITGYAGSSIGAVYASLAAVGYNYKEIFDILSSAGIDIFKDINIGFKKEIGFSKGNVFLEWIREKIEQKFYGEKYQKNKMEPVKFSDIKKNLVIYTVDLSNMCSCEFSSFQTPDFEIAMATRASVSMPGLFLPLEINKSLYVDGDLLKSAPLWRLCKSTTNLNERIIEFRLEDSAKPKLDNSIDYINAVYNAICSFATDYIIDLYKGKDKFDYIKINTPNISVVDFLIPHEKKQELYDIGYKTTDEYFKTTFIEKRKILKQKYKKLLEHILKFQKEFLKANMINSYLCLCETFLYLCEEKQYLDSALYARLCDFKNRYFANYQAHSFLGFKSASIENKNELAQEILDIIKELCAKIK
ncbi:patatin-like phospholipase family protein [bacterium]|nr:patatin-like phospholipase family protein [bacterium]